MALFSDWKLTPEAKHWFEEMEKMSRLEIAVGFQAGEKPYKDGTDLAAVAMYNEYGTSDTPARPFMKQSFDNGESKMKAMCDKVNKQIISGGSAEDGLHKLGTFAKGLIQQEIRDGDFEPNALSTIRSKGSDHPLIDTGHMRQSVNFVIRERSDD